MNLAIDIGNSSCKAGIYSPEKKEYSKYSGGPDKFFLDDILTRFRVKRAIISTVRPGHTLFTDILEKAGVESLVLSHKTPLPFKVHYESPETLGTDRLAAVAGACNMFPDTKVFIIDAGTAVTYDLLGADNIYHGGNISPGLQMRFRALHEFTGRLPLVERGNSFGNLGVNTPDAIRSGVQTGLIFEINDYIRTLKNKHDGMKVIITGGDAEFLSDKLEKRCILIPDLVIDGLNYILNYNA